MYLASADIQIEDTRSQLRRRLQQGRCLVCGARALVNHQTSYFCRLHIAAYRFCSLCETLRLAAEHSKDSHCKPCASRKALKGYHADPDRTIYRIRLRQIATRTATRGDQIFAGVRRRIWLAELVRRTPGLSWPKRAALCGMDATYLAYAYRQQTSDHLRDVDYCDRARDAHWKGRRDVQDSQESPARLVPVNPVHPVKPRRARCR